MPAANSFSVNILVRIHSIELPIHKALVFVYLYIRMILHLSQLPDVNRFEAMRYILNAPSSINTPLRRILTASRDCWIPRV